MEIETVKIVAPVTDDNPHGYVVINKSDHHGQPLFGEKKMTPKAAPVAHVADKAEK